MDTLTPSRISQTYWYSHSSIDQDSFSNWEGFYGMSNRKETVLTICLYFVLSHGQRGLVGYSLCGHKSQT